MPLKTSSFKKEIVKQDFRNAGWISIVYLLGLLFALPLQLMNELNSEFGPEPSDAGLFSFTFLFEIQSIFLFIMPVLMAVFLFRYMHIKGASDFVHSLPVRREKLFHYHIGSGVVMLVVPILLTSLVLLLFHLFVDVSPFYTLPELGYWTVLMVIVTLLVFMAGVFVGTLTGLSALQGVLTYVLLLFPAGIYGLLSFNISSFVVGFSGSTVVDQTMERYSPIIDVMNYYPTLPDGSFLPVGYMKLGAYMVLSIILYIAARLVYKKRSLESASQAIAVTSLKPVFKYGVTFCFMLFGGMYFAETQNSFPWLITGYVIGTIIGYLIAIMVIEKTWRVLSWRNFKGLLPYAITIAVLVALTPLLLSSYEKYIPETSEIEQVYVGHSLYQYQDKMAVNQPRLSNPESVEAARGLHEHLIKQSEPMTRGRNSFFIAYELENGDRVYRDYQVDREQVRSQLKKLYETKEYKELSYPALQVHPANVVKLSIESESPNRTQAIVVEPHKIEAALQHLKTDISNQSYREMVHEEGISSNLTIYTGNEDDSISMSLPRSYDQLIKWLKSENLYSDAFIEAEDIQQIKVVQLNDGQDARYRHQAFDQSLRSENSLISTDNSEIAKAIEQGKAMDKGEYLVGFYYTNNEDHPRRVLSFEEGVVPSFVLEHFK